MPSRSLAIFLALDALAIVKPAKRLYQNLAAKALLNEKRDELRRFASPSQKHVLPISNQRAKNKQNGTKGNNEQNAPGNNGKITMVATMVMPTINALSLPSRLIQRMTQHPNPAEKQAQPNPRKKQNTCSTASRMGSKYVEEWAKYYIFAYFLLLLPTFWAKTVNSKKM